MKQRKLFGAMTAVALFCLGFTACGGSDDADVNLLLQQTPVVSTTDPEGTVVVNFQKGSSSNEQSIGYGKIYVDNAGNFNSGDNPYYLNISFSSVGIVNGLSDVKTIPSTGWSQSIAITAGAGYIVGSTYYMGEGSQTYYARLYVVSVSPTGITVKYQSRFVLPIRLKQSKVTVDRSYHGLEVELATPTEVFIESTPDWCPARCFNFFNGKPSIHLDIQKNKTGQTRTGEVVLKNDLGSAKITIVQEG